MMGAVIRRLVAAGLMVGTLLLADPGAAGADDTEASYRAVETLLATNNTILDQALAYPASGPARVTAVIVSLQPGEETGWHSHDVPLFGYVLEGELTVDYAGYGTKVYLAGDSVMEAIGTAHNGRNSGARVMRILAVFMGAEGTTNSTPRGAPDSR
jgi:quercetin dioxygenase-like cupin family protein